MPIGGDCVPGGALGTITALRSLTRHDIPKHRTSVCETILAALDGRLAEDVNALDMRFVYAFAPSSLLSS